jgi:hypothetical protein
MYRVIRGRITYANVASTLALVFAMSGGAYAAKSYVITSTNQISPKVLKVLRGRTGLGGAAGAKGAAGPQGVSGGQGPKGETGANGENGASGTSGTSVAIKAFSGSRGKCTLGGSEFRAGSSATFACNGKEGSPWVDGGTLPSGATETGVLAAAGAPTPVRGAEEGIATTISFPIPLSEPLEASGIHFIKAGESPPEGCSGSLLEPQAEPGNLCVFEFRSNNVGQYVPLGVKAGIMLAVVANETTPGSGEFNKEDEETEGTWAVTEK